VINYLAFLLFQGSKQLGGRSECLIGRLDRIYPIWLDEASRVTLKFLGDNLDQANLVEPGKRSHFRQNIRQRHSLYLHEFVNGSYVSS
jgi:hypothetical protein